MLIHGAVDNDLHPPRFGGTQRAFGLFRGMARAHAVRVLCVVPNRTRAPLAETVDGVTLLRRKAWYTSAAWRLERLGLAPLACAADVHAWRARTLLAELGGTPDVFAAEFGLAGLLGHSRGAFEVYLSQNVEADFWPATAPAVAWRGAWADHLRAREARALARAALTVAVSEEDAARMSALYGASPARLEVIPNGWDGTRVRPPAAGERERARAALALAPSTHVAVFVGSDVPHNREGARLLVERVFPAMAKDGVVLLLAGRVADAFAGVREPWLRALGEVDDLMPVLHAADVGLNPVLRGGGSNVKLPTYLAAGLAVITTPFGQRGYPALAPLTVVAEPAAFADALRARPSGWNANGRAMPGAVAMHEWGRLGERLAERIAARRAGQDSKAPARVAVQGGS